MSSLTAICTPLLAHIPYYLKPAPYWIMSGTSRVQYTGIASGGFTNDTAFVGPYTIIPAPAAIQQRCRQHGYIRQVKAYISAAVGNIKFNLFRPSGSNYTFIAESELIALTGTGVAVEFNLSTPIPCQPGDVLGVYMSSSSGQVTGKTMTNGGLYLDGDVTTTWTGGTSTGFFPCIEGLGISPYLAVAGDSIVEGHPTWLSHYDVGPAGTLTDEPWYQLRQLIKSTQINGFEYQNFGMGGQTYAFCETNAVPDALATGAEVILILAGVNDINNSRTWADVLANLDAIKVLFDASTTAVKLLIGEILPWTNGTDAQALTVRTWNTNIAAWCTTNSATLIPWHNTMGKVRSSTGELDDLKTAYDLDGVHLTPAGYAAMATIAASYIRT